MKSLLAGLALVALASSAFAQEQRCSSLRDACADGTRSRNQSSAPCYTAYNTCVRTGIWETYGPYGRKIVNVVKN